MKAVWKTPTLLIQRGFDNKVSDPVLRRMKEQKVEMPSRAHSFIVACCFRTAGVPGMLQVHMTSMCYLVRKTPFLIFYLVKLL